MTEEVLFSDITDGCPQGEGVFDKMMKSVKSHLMEEYNAQRIRGSEYSQVYLNALQASMGQSIQWQLGAQIAENQAKLIEKQIEGQEKQNLLLEEQRALLIAQTSQVTQQTQNLVQELANLVAQEALINAQALEKTYQVQDLLPAQKVILDQKLITEEAQTKTTTSQGAVTGTMGAQRELYAKQKDGFDRDAEQKAGRIVTDTWGISVSADMDGSAVPAEVNKEKVDEVLRQLREGAGILGDV